MYREQTKSLAITALFVAIFLLQTFVPNIGYIRILPALPAVTTAPLTVAVYSLLMGPVAGTFFGIFWGLLRWILAYTQPGDIVSLMLFQNIFISFIPSTFAGLFPGLIGKIIQTKQKKVKKIGYAAAGAITSLTNTVLVIALTSLIFISNSAKLIGYIGNFPKGTPLVEVLIIALGTNGLIEAIFTAAVTSIVVIPMKIAMKRIE